MEERKGLTSFVFKYDDKNDDDVSENIVSDILQLVGWTPLIELKSIAKKEGVDVRLVAKMESYQPHSSVKDRIALRMIEDAEKKGFIKPGITTIIEPTSGNLGIGLAYIARRKGYKFIAVVRSHNSSDKRMLLRYLGADVSVTDSKDGFKGIMDRVEELKTKDPNAHVLDQFNNPSNPVEHFMSTGPDCHYIRSGILIKKNIAYSTTGPEIWKDTGGKVDFLVCSAGSGGTISGAGKYLKIKNPAVKVICVEPAESPVFSGGKPGIHNIQGTGPGIVPKNLDKSCIDEILTVTTKQAMVYARRIAREEGLIVGISSGANLAACLQIAERVESKGKMIVTVFPSGGEKYMSTELFDEVRKECINMSF